MNNLFPLGVTVFFGMYSFAQSSDTSLPAVARSSPHSVNCANFNIHNPESDEFEVSVSYNAKDWMNFGIRKQERKIIHAKGHSSCYVGVRYKSAKRIYKLERCKLYMLLLRGDELILKSFNEKQSH